MTVPRSARILAATRRELRAWRERVRGAGDVAEDAELLSVTLPRLEGTLARAPRYNAAGQLELEPES